MAASDFVTPNFCAETIAPTRPKSRDVSGAFLANAIALAEILVDFLICSAGALVASSLSGQLDFNIATQHSIREIADMSVAFGFVSPFLIYRDRSYRSDSGLLQIRETERSLRISVQALFLMLVTSSLLAVGYSSVSFIVGLLLIPTSLIFEKWILLSMVKRLRRGRRRAERTVVYGTGGTARILASVLLQSPRLGLEPVALIGDASELVDGGILEMGYRWTRPFCFTLSCLPFGGGI